jgi:hypothetical protein
MRLEYMRQHKAWKAELASQAPQLPSDPIEPEEDVEEVDTRGWDELPVSSAEQMQMSAPSTQQPWAADEVEDYLQREDEELEALLQYMSQADVEANAAGREMETEHFGSDDEDFEALFSEVLEREQQAIGDYQAIVPSQSSGEAMDMS